MNMNMNIDKTNKVYIVGTLVETNLNKNTTKDGREYISGDLIIKSNDQLIEGRIFAFKLKKDGTENKLYKNYLDIDEKYLGKRIKASGELSENLFFSENNNQVISYNYITIKFIEPAKEPDDYAKFDFTGYVVKPISEKLNKDGELIRYEIVLGQMMFNEKPMYVKFTIDKDNTLAASKIAQVYTKGSTVNIGGDIQFKVETVEIEKQVAFGEPQKRTVVNIYKDYVITSGSEPLMQGTYSPELIKHLNTEYIANKESLEKERYNDNSSTQNSRTNSTPKTPYINSLI